MLTFLSSNKKETGTAELITPCLSIQFKAKKLALPTGNHSDSLLKFSTG